MGMNKICVLKNISLLLVLFVFAVPSKGQNKTEQLDSLFRSMANRGDFNGTVLISENGKPIYKNAFGFSDLEAKVPLNDQSMFELASVSKQFTAMAILQLKEKNKLQYDEPLQKYFKELPYPGVTIRDLLQHTSGIPEFLGLTKDKLKNPGINTNADILAILPDVFPAASFQKFLIGLENTAAKKIR
ncbi:MAG: class A beta-lactamase-related serine hydrolase [Sphingobacteriales bacterium]|nr:MAG: class A beta-lactamase-related serine hydrolase [Sphingobacteriales bacterium]